MTEQLEQAWAAIDPERLKQTLLEMIDIYSPSGKEEDIQLYLEERLKQAGVEVVRQEVEEERYNLLATMGAAQPPLYLVGHVDTVTAWDIEDYAALTGNDIRSRSAMDLSQIQRGFHKQGMRLKIKRKLPDLIHHKCHWINGVHAFFRCGAVGLFAGTHNFNDRAAFFSDIDFFHVFPDIGDDGIGRRYEVVFQQKADAIIDPVGIGRFLIG